MAHRTLLAETGVQLAAETQGIEADCLAEDALHLGVQISPEGDATVQCYRAGFFQEVSRRAGKDREGFDYRYVLR